jgi:next to BRCA1 gene 1 protein
MPILTPKQFIYGVRHKCLNCPDFDFCSDCVKGAKTSHPRHRFVPIYEPLAEPNSTAVRHYGIYCDGPLCKDKENLSYIEGVRYKCAVCHDTDFCANCEAIPTNRHNRTHPLIKFKTPVRSVSVTTLGEDKNGVPFARMGDQPVRKSTATETVPVVASVNAATQVQTVVDMKPMEDRQEKPITDDKIEPKDSAPTPVNQIRIPDLLSTPLAKPQLETVKSEAIAIPKSEKAAPVNSLDAHFIRETIVDGTQVVAESQFVQVWTLRNPSNTPWPAGCSVRHVGGDNMLNLDNTQPLSQSELAEASESNVIGRPVEYGEEISFRVVLKAPKREGTAISYWRLKTADGTPFGHRLWCDITVIPPPTPATSLPKEPSPPVWSSPEDVPQSPLLSTDSSSKYDAMKQRPLDGRFLKRLAEVRLKAQQKKALARESAETVRNRADIERADRAKSLRYDAARRKAVERLCDTQAAIGLRIENAAQEQEVPHLLNTTGRYLDVTSDEPSVEVPQEEAHEDTAEAKEEVGNESVEEVTECHVEQTQIKEEPEPQPQTSVMIFPQLEKESPASSTHQVDAATVADTTPANTAVAGSSADSDTDLFEDAESLEIMDGSSDDGSFLTDEEYDILDASDEEMP